MKNTTKQNNPFNIIRTSIKWFGELAGFFTDKFESFATLEFGVRAGMVNLKNGYLKKGISTPSAIIKKYAPLSDNKAENQKNYIGFVAQKVHGNKYLTEKKISGAEEWIKLSYAIMYFENGKEILTINQITNINNNEKIFI